MLLNDILVAAAKVRILVGVRIDGTCRSDVTPSLLDAVSEVKERMGTGRDKTLMYEVGQVGV